MLASGRRQRSAFCFGATILLTKLPDEALRDRDLDLDHLSVAAKARAGISALGLMGGEDTMKCLCLASGAVRGSSPISAKGPDFAADCTGEQLCALGRRHLLSPRTSALTW